MKELLERCVSDMTSVSKDSDHNVSMIISEQKIVNFDDCQKHYFNIYNSKKPFESIDGLLKIKDTWYFIEFKNGVIDNKVKRNIREKVLASLMTLLDITNKTLRYARTNICFILVYNEIKNAQSNDNVIQSSASRDRIKARIHDLANTSSIRFGLTRYKKIFFKEVYTLNEKEFDSFLTEHEAGMKQNIQPMKQDSYIV